MCVCSLLIAASGLAIAGPKNVILMISDGWGYNQIAATNYYYGTTASYQGSDFVSFAMQTNSANNPAGYNVAQAWVSDGMGGVKPNYDYLKNGIGATDSASAITAMMTGVKNYDGQVNWSTTGQPLTTFAEISKTAGKAVGAISNVELSHATPAGVFSHNSSRNNYSQIANECIASNMDVLIGAGNPEYDDNGNPATKTAQFVGGDATWVALKDGTAGGSNPWTLVQNRADFQSLATGATPNRLFGVITAHTTAQQARSAGNAQEVHPETFNAGVATLAETSLAALNVLDNNSNGFFAMIEGGAVDWANHANQKGRLIEEQKDFNDAVDAVINYINTYSSWDDTLLIVTGDHECGLLLGPNGETSIVDNGVGAIAGMKYFSGSHSNSLIPLFAKGAGSDLFSQYATGLDPVRGAYIDNTDIFKVMYNSTVPEPGSIVALVTGLAGFAGVVIRRRR